MLVARLGMQAERGPKAERAQRGRKAKTASGVIFAAYAERAALPSSTGRKHRVNRCDRPESTRNTTVQPLASIQQGQSSTGVGDVGNLRRREKGRKRRRIH